MARASEPLDADAAFGHANANGAKQALGLAVHRHLGGLVLARELGLVRLCGREVEDGDAVPGEEQLAAGEAQQPSGPGVLRGEREGLIGGAEFGAGAEGRVVGLPPYLAVEHPGAGDGGGVRLAYDAAVVVDLEQVGEVFDGVAVGEPCRSGRGGG